MQSSAFHAQIIDKVHTLFPSLTIQPNTHNHSVFQSIDKLVGYIPVPSHFDAGLTLNNMRNVVDGQEFRIQINMMDHDHQELQQSRRLCHKISDRTQQSSESGDVMEESQQWAWNQDEIRSNCLDSQFCCFLD